MTDQLEFEWNARQTAPPPPAAPPQKDAAALRLSAQAQRVAQANELHRELAAHTPLPLLLRITNNRSTMMSLRYSPDGKQARLSLHHMFLEAGPEVRRALAAWIKKPRSRKPGETLNAFIREQSHRIAPSLPRETALQLKGQHHDLLRYYQELNDRFFNNTITARITWGIMPRLKRRTSIRFGSYSPKDHIIRMHPLLDQAFVPEFFVRYIVFHEMLHAHLGIEETPSGRRCIHTREFKQSEKLYPDYDRALEWMRKSANLNQLLQARRK